MGLPTLQASHRRANLAFKLMAIIVIIPILILRQSQMRTLTKIGLGVFLCLSVFMLLCSIIRASTLYIEGALDFPWQYYWLHTEACISVIMASITVHRSTLVGSNEVSDRLQLYLQRILRRKQIPDSEVQKPRETRRPQFGLKGISFPRAILTGLRTAFDGGSHKTCTVTTDIEASNQD